MKRSAAALVAPSRCLSRSCDKIRHIKETGVEVVIAADHGCILNISTALHKQGLDHIKVYSLYDFIWQRVSPGLTGTIPSAMVGGV